MMFWRNQTFFELRSLILDFDDIVVPHWNKFKPPDPLYNYGVGTYIGVVGILGMMLNLLVILIFMRMKPPMTLQNMLIINLAISDFSFSAVIGFPLKTIAAFNQRWAWGKQACQIYGFCGGFFGFLSLTTIAVIAIERYEVIIKPFGLVTSVNRSRAIITIMGIWIWSILWPMPPVFGYGRYVLEGFQTSCTFDYISTDYPNIVFNMGMYIFGFLTPLCISIFCYIRIVSVVRRHESDLNSIRESYSSKNRTPLHSESRKMNIEIAKTSSVLLLLYLMSWSPYATVCFVSLLGRQDFLTPEIAEIPCLFAKTSAIYNPIVYAIGHPKFQMEIKRHYPLLSFLIPKRKRKIDGFQTRRPSVDKFGLPSMEMVTVGTLQPRINLESTSSVNKF